MDSDVVLLLLKNYFEPHGLEVHLFKVGWYNKLVNPAFHLPYDENTVAYVVISTPSMFEKAFLPYLKSKMKDENAQTQGDPLDKCLTHHFLEAKELFPEFEVVAMQDFEILPNKRPKILVQTAAHVSGAAYYYQKKDIEDIHDESCPLSKSPIENIPTEQEISKVKCSCTKPWDSKRRIYGVCIHQEYGGWFAIRGVLIFPNLINATMQAPILKHCVHSREERIELLNRFNNHWQDWTYRDIIPVKEKYSEMQKLYFATLPKNRHSLLPDLLSK